MEEVLPPEDITGTISPDSTDSIAGTVKSGDGNSPNDGGRGSPPPNCAICLGKCRNKSFTDSCLHQFCFKCLLTWSKVKTECPLCKQNFKAIIHNVRSNQQYEEYPVEQPRRTESIDFSDFVSATRRFRYRTTLTLPRRETLAIQQFLLHYPLSALIDDMSPAAAVSERRRSPQDFRRTVYRHNLWARPLPDFTGRFRNCSPDFFRYNESQMHRLLPWLNRELYYLLNENTGHISYVLSRIVELLPQHRITAPEFRDAMRCYFGERTEHFLHEFYCFASTPYDLTGYDRNVQYQTDSRVSSVVNEVLSSSDSEASHDSDIVVVSSSHAAAPGPSRAPPPRPLRPDVVPIETISHSDTDSDSSVMVVGYIKPPHQRTPEHVDLVASDSDVVVQEEGAAPAVKLTLSRPRPAPPSDSEGEAPRPARRRRRTPPPREPAASPRSYTPPLAPRPPRSDDDYTCPDTSDSGRSSSAGSSASSSRPRRPARRRQRARKSRRTSRRRSRTSSSRRTSADDDGPRISVETQTENGRWRRSNKSRNGKGVKSSKRVRETECGSGAPRRDSPAPGGSAPGKRRRSAEGARARDAKRLRSVVAAVAGAPAAGAGAAGAAAARSSDSDSDNIPLSMKL